MARNVVRGTLEPPPPGTIIDLPQPASPEGLRLAHLGRAAIANGELGVCILNGGMATRFGGIVKGLLEPVPGRSLLELKVRDVAEAMRRYGGPIHVFLMNSFSTDQATRAHFSRHLNFGLDAGAVHHLRQAIWLRMDRAGDLFTEDGQLSPYSPGHGEFFSLMRSSGALEGFRAAGGRYLLVSSVDNVAARVSPIILGLHILSHRAVTAEVALRRADTGGAPYLNEGEVAVVEHLRFPCGFDPGAVGVLSTNTMTFTASELEAEFDLNHYYIEKTVHGRVAVQIERLLCDITSKLPTGYVRVPRDGPRTRFVPLKVPGDLQVARPVLAAMLQSAAT